MMNETSHYIAVVGFLTYMRQCAGPFRVRVMPADHRSAPSHYLCQWLFIVDWTLADKLRRNLTWNVPFRQIHVQFSSTKRWSGPFQYICNALRSCITLKRKSLHFDEMFITGCTGSCQTDNFQCSQWWKLRQNDDIFVSVYTGNPCAWKCCLFIEMGPMHCKGWEQAGKRNEREREREIEREGIVRRWGDATDHLGLLPGPYGKYQLSVDYLDV